MKCTAFVGTKRIVSGELQEVAVRAKEAWDRESWTQVLIFDNVTSEPVEVDFSGSPEDVLARVQKAAEEPARRPGRPKLGVIAREVTLLPRHWDWLAGQPGGASVALRKLVEQARAANRDADRRRHAQESAYRFLSAMAGNEPGYEEAIRALFAGRKQRFHEMMEAWPADVRDHARMLAEQAFAE